MIKCLSIIFKIKTFIDNFADVQPMDLVCSCVNLTDSNVISASLSVREREISQVFCKCGLICNGLRNGEIHFIKSIPISVFPSALNNLERNVSWNRKISRKIHISFQSKKKFENELLTSLCFLFVRPFICQHETTLLPLVRILWKLNSVSKICRQNKEIIILWQK
jgi:hypothetical protein